MTNAIDMAAATEAYEETVDKAEEAIRINLKGVQVLYNRRMPSGDVCYTIRATAEQGETLRENDVALREPFVAHEDNDENCFDIFMPQNKRPTGQLAGRHMNVVWGGSTADIGFDWYPEADDTVLTRVHVTKTSAKRLRPVIKRTINL